MVRFGKAGKKIIHVPEVLTEYWWHSDNIGQHNPDGGEFPLSNQQMRSHVRNLAIDVHKGAK
jgi:hypothetical protein